MGESPGRGVTARTQLIDAIGHAHIGHEVDSPSAHVAAIRARNSGHLRSPRPTGRRRWIEVVTAIINEYDGSVTALLNGHEQRGCWV